MPNLAAVLKTEIARLARRSTRPLYIPLKKDVAALKRALAQQRRLTAQLARDNARLVADLNSRHAAPSMASPDEVQHARMSPRLVRSQRARLGLARDSFAKLLGVTGGAVLAWESGRSKPRATAKAAIIAIRSLGKREARERLAAMVGANRDHKAPARGSRKRKSWRIRARAKR